MPPPMFANHVASAGFANNKKARGFLFFASSSETVTQRKIWSLSAPRLSRFLSNRQQTHAERPGVCVLRSRLPMDIRGYLVDIGVVIPLLLFAINNKSCRPQVDLTHHLLVFVCSWGGSRANSAPVACCATGASIQWVWWISRHTRTAVRWARGE